MRGFCGQCPRAPRAWAAEGDAIVPDGAAAGIFTDQASVFTALRNDQGSCRVVFSAFPFDGVVDGLDPNNRATLLERIRSFMTSTGSVNPAPVVDTIRVSPAYVRPGTPVEFSGGAHDPDGGAVTYEWDFGDGTRALGATVRHTYGRLGHYRPCCGSGTTTAERPSAGPASPSWSRATSCSSGTSRGSWPSTCAGWACDSCLRSPWRSPAGTRKGLENYTVVGTAGEFGRFRPEHQALVAEHLRPPATPSRLALMWFDPTAGTWQRAQPQAVVVVPTNGWGGYVEVRLDATSSPSLAWLTGTIFGAGVPNQAPVASAGPGRYGAVGSPVRLSGAASRDPDAGDSVTSYRWRLVAKPAGSGAELDRESADADATFIPDKAGRCEVQLVVKDSFAWESRPDTVAVEVLATYAAPNPARASVTFHHDTGLSGGTVRIYDVAGRLVRVRALDASGETAWDLTDTSGRPVASGLYLWLLFDRDGKLVFTRPERLVVQR